MSECLSDPVSWRLLRGPERYKARRKILAAHRAELAKEKRLWNGRYRKYGITYDMLNQIWKSQGERCAVCKKAVEVAKTHIDHNHKTGKVRGILCSYCNVRVLPVIEHHSDLIAAAQKYLEG